MLTATPGYPVINFCTTHKEPDLPLSDDTIRLEIGPPGTLDRDRHRHVLNCFNEVPAAQPYRKELAIVSGLLTARRLLQRERPDPDTVVNFVTYRLFMLPARLQHHRQPVQMNFVSSDEVAEYRADISPVQVATDWLLPRFFPGPQIEASYAERHGGGWFDLFTEAAVAEGALSAEEARQMRSNALHFTAMGIGRMPVNVFCDIAERAETAVMRFLRDHAADIPPQAQFQCALFPYERLAIYLMELEVRRRFAVIPTEIFGYWTMLSNERKYVPGTLEIE